MQILAHRGWWSAHQPKNSPAALAAAISAGLGVETDIRDLDGRLVISHDPPTQAEHVDLEAFLALVARSPRAGTLALNIKADGLQARLAEQLAAHGLDNWFAFDMSVPDLLGWRRRGLPHAVRLSEFEDGGPLLAEAGWVWLDAFERDDWYPDTLIPQLLAQGKRVAVVSPELHGRSHGVAAAWERLKNQDDGSGRLMLCTDLVAQALETFNV